MTVLVGKFRDFFSDLFLNLELMFTRTPKSEIEMKPMPTPIQESPAPMQGVMPLVSSAPKVIGAAQLMNIQAKAVAEKKEKAKNAKLPYGLKHLHLSTKGRLYFYDQMATLVGSGVPLIDSLSLIQAQEKNKNIKRLYVEMIHDINAGLSLAEAMEMFRTSSQKCNPPWWKLPKLPEI